VSHVSCNFYHFFCPLISWKKELEQKQKWILLLFILIIPNGFIYIYFFVPYEHSVTLEKILIQNSIVLKITLFSHRSVPASVKQSLKLEHFLFYSYFIADARYGKLIIDNTEIVEFEIALDVYIHFQCFTLDIGVYPAGFVKVIWDKILDMLKWVTLEQEWACEVCLVSIWDGWSWINYSTLRSQLYFG
jgi:hypothetical protein